MFTLEDIKGKRVDMKALLRDKEPKWNLPRENGGWDVDWKHELATQRRRAQLEKDDDDDDKGDGAKNRDIIETYYFSCLEILETQKIKRLDKTSAGQL